MSLDPTVALALVEVAKISVQSFFSLMRQAGKTEEEIAEMYAEEKAKFALNRPENLPDPE